MRIITKLVVVLCVVAGGYFAYSKVYKRLPTVTIKTEQPTRRNIVHKKVFSGNLIPHKEIKLKTHMTGVVEKLFVRVGDYIPQGAAIARIKIQPSTKAIEDAESKLRLASIARNEARTNFLRNEQLFKKKMLAKQAYEKFVTDWEKEKENFAMAQKHLQIAQRGYTKEKGIDVNVIKATTKGTILALPAKEGSMVQETSTQSEGGTTVAIIGDMDQFMFSAQVTDLDVVYLTKGMTFEASLNAFPEEKFQVTLTTIAPKANEKGLERGDVKFDIEGTISKPKKSKIILRAGYVVLAEVIVEQVQQVLAIPDKMIQEEGHTYFVKCWNGTENINKNVVLGLSDGLYTEIKEGLTEADQLIIEE
ncbi:efflux RND transporter periplasmic adaptor subunit [Candidatus Cardinium hertigii]|jgi:HlyD family secretion protein|uniref:Efflux RND transporter periplasmic adaptor subunit n=1 Tax=Candidatus Cardinium hertigii TaxID=247481 RepID=A0A3N2QB89_9BACT|nr:efflux RND transporter periplasmic adaptor subunit [Candidatus Cardinium hertigii]ROT47083.1 efflux RND transporter periplasmic adaptor subunit [Candidatus Cardinium hertigii]